MKVKISTIIRILVYFDVLARYHFFYIFNLPASIESALNLNNYTFISALLACISCSIVLSCFRYKIEEYYKHVRKYILFVIFAFVCICMYTYVKYPAQSIYFTIRYGSKLLILLWIPSYLYLFRCDLSSTKLFDFLNNVSTIWNFLCVFCTLVYSVSGNVLLHLTTVNYRVYGLRIGMGFLGSAMLLYNFTELYNNKFEKKNKLITACRFVLGLICLVFIQQTRVDIFCVIACIIAQILFAKKTKTTKLKELFIVAAIVSLVFVTGMAEQVLSSFSRIDVETENISTTARLYSLNYYFEIIKKSPIFGNGFVFCDTGSPYFYIEHGSTGRAFYGDVGLIGNTAELGIFAILIFFIPIFILTKQMKPLRILYSSRSQQYYFTLLIILNLLICTITTLSVLDKGRIAIYPIIIAYVIYNSNSRRELNEL